MARMRARGGDLGAFGLLIAMMLPNPCRAATWQVTYDPAQPEDRVGAVAAQAASGDTILIDPGTYYEHIPLEGKSLIFIGTAGAASTILDGSRELAGRSGSIIYTVTGASASLVVRGVTLRGGTGTVGIGSAIFGGAISWMISRLSEDRLAIVDCVFEDDTAQCGGAVSTNRLSEVRLERCSFLGNTAHYSGADISCYSSETEIVQCSFRVDDGNWNGEHRIEQHYSPGTLTIRGCTIETDVTPRSYAWFLGSSVDRTEIRDSRFIDHRGPLATRVALSGGPVEGEINEILISGNTFWKAASGDNAFGEISLDMPNGRVDIRENTFVRCGVWLANSWQAPSLVFERNIMSVLGAAFAVPAGGTVSCNDFWRAPMEDYYGRLTVSNNLSEAPLFCNEPAGQLEIARASPCAAENSPSGCGRIGALDPACDMSPVKQMSWGKIKALFR